jgi:hypothetical protein
MSDLVLHTKAVMWLHTSVLVPYTMAVHAWGWAPLVIRPLGEATLRGEVTWCRIQRVRIYTSDLVPHTNNEYGDSRPRALALARGQARPAGEPGAGPTGHPAARRGDTAR